MSFGFGIGDILAVTKLACAIRQRWSDAPSEYAAARNEIKTLESLLQDLSSLDESIFPLAQRATLDDAVNQCESVLIAAGKIVDDYSTPSPNRLFKSWKRLKADPDDVRHLRSRLTAAVTQLNAIQNNVQIELDRGLLEGIQDIKLDHDEEKRLKVADWFSSTAFAQQQTAQLNIRETGTATWFLQHPIYHTWRDGPKQTLFCPGIPGSGKSVIFATVIADLQTYFKQTADTVVAYFYCNHKRRSEQTLPLILTTLVRQLFQERLSIPQPVQDVYEEHVKRGSRPTVDELTELMVTLCRMYTKVLILVDALDECDEDDDYQTRNKLLSSLVRLQKNDSTNINLMTTCRPGIVTRFDICPQIEIRAQSQDIARYLRANVPQVVACTRRRSDLQERIVEEIADIVDGMFLLARLHLESLRDKTNARAVLQALNRLPRGSQSAALDQAYDAVLDRINQQLQGRKDLAQKSLIWLTFTKRELTMEELQEALAIEPGMRNIDHENDIDDEETITAVCAGLISVNSESGTVKLTHYTAQVYLQLHLGGTPKGWLLNGKDYVARSCITYLSMQKFYVTEDCRDKDIWDLMQEYKLLHYIGKHWGFHLGELHYIPNYFRKILDNDSFWYFAAQLVLGNHDALYDRWCCIGEGISQLQIFAYFNNREYLQFLLDEGYELKFADSLGRSALHIAAQYGCSNATSTLLAQDQIDPNARDRSGRTPLLYAACMGHGDIVTQLLARKDIGPSVNLYDKCRQTPLRMALLQGHVNTVAQLLAREDIGPSVSLRDENGFTVLALAVHRGYHKVVTKLLARQDIGQTINMQNDRGDTALALAALCGHSHIVAQLLSREDIGPSVNLPSRRGRTPLHNAFGAGHAGIIAQLLARPDIGPSLNIQDEDGRTLLHYALSSEYREVAAQLLARKNLGININLPDEQGLTLLSHAARAGYNEIVAQLLNQENVGPSINRQDEYYQTPLSWAVLNANFDIVVQLLAREDIGPSLNLGDGSGGTPLSRAADLGLTKVVALLLARKDIGPSMNLRHKYSGETILSRAARGYYKQAIGQLISEYDASR